MFVDNQRTNEKKSVYIFSILTHLLSNSYSITPPPPHLQNTAQFYRLKPQHDAEQRLVEAMEKVRKKQELEYEQERAKRENRARIVAKEHQLHPAHFTHPDSEGPATIVPSQKNTASRVLMDDKPVTKVSKDPEVLQLLADIRQDETERQKSPQKKNIELAKRKQKLFKQSRSRKSPTKYSVPAPSPIRKIDSDVRSMLSPTVDQKFALLTSRGSGSGSRLPTPHLVPEQQSNRITGRAKSGRKTGRVQTGRATGRVQTGRATGRSTMTTRSTSRNNSVVGGIVGQAAELIVSPTKKKRGGAAAVLDLSELTKGLEVGGSTYKNEYGEEMMPAIRMELKRQNSTFGTQFWLPKTEQTVINEMVSRARKIQRQIDGLED